MELTPLTSEKIVPGMVVVDIGPSSRPGGGLQTNIQVGRVIEGSLKRYALLEMLRHGIIVEFDILAPKEYHQAREVIYTTFFASQQGPAFWPALDVYAWPDLVPLTFSEDLPGRIEHVQIKFRRGVVTPLILEE